MTEASAKSDGWGLPVLQGVLPIRASQIPAEVIAGLTLAALAIPEVMGYTKISGTPVITGLYTILIPMALFALFGSSRHLVVGADSATAAILAAGFRNAKPIEEIPRALADELEERLGIGRTDIVAVQALLKREGFYDGSLDGVAGSGTRAAIRAFETESGLRPTGVISRAMTQKLGLKLRKFSSSHYFDIHFF